MRSSNNQEMETVNVDEGFLPKFSDAFLERYGRESIFVRTLSDYFTSNLVRVLEVNGMLNNPDTVAMFSNQVALDLLSEWFRSVDGATQIAFQESIGRQPVGSLESLVDKTLGQGRFQQWLNWLKEKE